MAELAIKNFPKQQEVFNSKTRFKIVAKGRRFGLTRGKANDFMAKAFKREFKQGLWIDTVHSNINRYVDRYFIPQLKKLPKGLWEWKKQDKILHIVDSFIDFRSADRSENIEGFGYDDVFLNEAGIILRNPHLWYNTVQPMLLEYNAPAVIGGNPKGKGLFYELYLKGLSDDHPDYQAFHFTTYDNPYLKKEVIDTMVADMPKMVAKQEIFGEFLEDAGTVFRGVVKVLKALPQKPIANHLYIMGVDLAKVQDYTVIVVYDKHTNSQVYQDRFKTLEWPFQKKRIATVARHYNDALVVLDATGIGDPIADDLLRAGVAVQPVKITNTGKKEMIEKLMLWIEQGKLSMLNIKETLNEFTSFTYDMSKTGKITYNAPGGMHDDCFVAGTFVLTDKGQIPIENVRVGDMVMTRKGYKPVVFARSSIKPIISHPLGLRGTRTHPIITKKTGIKPLALARGNDIIYMWNEKQSYIEERNIIDILTQKESNIADITGDTINGKSRLFHSTDKYGLITLVRYLKGMLFTIEMETLSIMGPKTLKLYQNQNMQRGTWVRQNEGRCRQYQLRNKVKDFIYLLLTGKVNNPGKNVSVLNVVQALMLKLIRIKYFVLNYVKIVTLGRGDDCPAIVHNIQVEGCPEYFANNILVHNCVIAHALALTELFDIYKPKKKRVSRIKAELVKRASTYYPEDTYEPI